ncbi:MAG: hypothetical protein NWQ13_10305 [Glaciimonas sp.]|nr:hypothetical protein [Glaciimonas sp.]
MNNNFKIGRLSTGLICLLVVTISGCATWKHPTKSESEFYSEKLYCEGQAVQMYPTVIVNQLNPGYVSPGNTYCQRTRDNNDNKTTICNTTPGVYMPPSYSQNDVNSSSRDEASSSCLKAGGWRLVY